MTGGTVCSGIMAPEAAMPWVDWQWCAEIEPFPCSVISAFGRKNLGDIMAADFSQRAGYVDLLVGGTPCQAFSVAGLRGSLADKRGNLTLRFVEIVHAIRPRIVLWENVPGVLSTRDNAFGCFLAGLVGADSPIAPATKWTSSGVVTGPIGTAAWRIADAQYFGLAQRRARLFLVFCFGDGTDPQEILFEFQGLRRDSPPRREKGKDVTAGVESSAANSGGLIPCSAIPILEAGARTGVSTTDKRVGVGVGVGVDGDPMYTLQSGKQHAVAFHENQRGEISISDTAGSLKVGGGKPGQGYAAVAIDLRNGSINEVAMSVQSGGMGDERGLCPNAIPHTLAYGISNQPTPKFGADVIPTPLNSHNLGGGMQEAVAFTERTRADGRNLETQNELAYALTNPGSGGRTHSRQLLTPTMAVRRLTPRECERLQGFADDYTQVAHRGKPAADGPRYKALGNSMAVPVIAWIGERIRMVCRNL